MLIRDINNICDITHENEKNEDMTQREKQGQYRNIHYVLGSIRLLSLNLFIADITTLSKLKTEEIISITKLQTDNDTRKIIFL